MGWLFVCFDLPVEEKDERRQAARFRKDLLNYGYFMLQNSIYVRSCVTYEKTDKYIKILKSIAPTTGSVNVFYLTDRQWSLSVCIEKRGYKKSKYQQKIGVDAPKQMTFW
jgi:CRISPR-associated protein Cas2